MYFSIDTLVSWLKTKFLQPNSSALTIPNPNVTSGIFFSPSITVTRRSASKSKANPISLSFVFDMSFSNWSVVGSGPLELFTKSSFIVFTSQPIFFNNSD